VRFSLSSLSFTIMSSCLRFLPSQLIGLPAYSYSYYVTLPFTQTTCKDGSVTTLYNYVRLFPPSSFSSPPLIFLPPPNFAPSDLPPPHRPPPAQRAVTSSVSASNTSTATSSRTGGSLVERSGGLTTSRRRPGLSISRRLGCSFRAHTFLSLSFRRG
jgi:hypothetical protein